MFQDSEITEVYAELQKIAAIHLNRFARTPSLQPTLLVHEAWVRLSGRGWKSRTHFLALASRTMRMVLIDAVRARMAGKRGGSWERVEWSDPAGASFSLPLETVIEVDRALTGLMEKDARKAQVVEMRFFGGLEFQEIAEALDISLATVRRDWEFARAWLFARLSPGPDGSGAAGAV